MFNIIIMRVQGRTLCVADSLISWKFLRSNGANWRGVDFRVYTRCGVVGLVSGTAAIGIEFPLANFCAELARHVFRDRQRDISGTRVVRSLNARL